MKYPTLNNVMKFRHQLPSISGYSIILSEKTFDSFVNELKGVSDSHIKIWEEGDCDKMIVTSEYLRVYGLAIICNRKVS